MRIYFHTFGCKANQYDTEVIRQAVESAGALAVSDPTNADVVVVNSCAVTHTGEAKMRGFVRRIHRKYPSLQTVVMGCAAALDDGLIASLPGVSSVVANSAPADVLKSLGLETRSPDPVLRSFLRGARAWLKIQDGCDEHCTFCATTIARGASRSRPADEVVTEARALAEHHAEIVLTGVHIGGYGRDLPEASSLGKLVERLVTDVPDVRFRLSSVEATEIDDRLVELLCSAPDNLAPHVHAPLQSGSDRVLKRMGRHWYTAKEYRARCDLLAERIPALGLGADVIAGFPGETRSDHMETIALIEESPFTYLHVFPYSERPHASARRMGASVKPGDMAARSEELRELAAEKGAAYRCRREGESADVVTLDRKHGTGRGLTGDFLDVSFSTDRVSTPRFEGVIKNLPDHRLAVEVSV